VTKTTAFLLLICVVSSSTLAQSRAVLTPRAAKAVQSDSPTSTRTYWLFLDSTAFSSRPVDLTERARARRAKADPSGLLVDGRDVSISSTTVDRIRHMGVRVRQLSRWFKAVSVEASPTQIDQLVQLDLIRQIDLVARFNRISLPEPAESERIPMPPDATTIDLNYGGSLTQNLFIKAVKMHRAGYTGKGILIAMFDSGFNTNHVAFDSTSIVTTRDFINGDTDVTGSDCTDEPQDRHGTVTFGVVGGYVPGTLIGTAFEADFALAKTEITCGGTEIKVEEDNWIAAAEWADSIGADIITASLGYYIFQDSGSYTMDQLDGNTARITIAADIAASKNILVCTAGGNERNDAVWPTIIFPADGDSVLAVGATNPDSLIASFSSPGPSADGRIKPDIVTMGQAVFSASSTGGYSYSSGTSLSTPLVAGGAALAFDFDSTLTAMELLEQIKQTGDRAENPDNNYGYGLMDASRAANILRVVVAESIYVDSGVSFDLPVGTSGKATELPILEAFGLPPGVSFVDSGAGRGSIHFDSAAQLQRLDTFGIVAAITDFADTAWVVVSSSVSTVYSNRLIAYPNPFERTVTVNGGMPENPLRAVTIFSSSGEKVWEKVNISPGSSDTISIEWDGRNSSGQSVAPGVYLLLVETPRGVVTIKVVKVR
jgi:hypothetical protein